MSTFRSLSSMDSARAPAISAQECRSYSAQCMTLGMEPNLSLQRAAILSEMVRSWTTLANQMDRYEAIPTEAGKYLFRDGELLVEPRHLEVWNEFPNAVFLVTTAPAPSGVRYVLRGYELPEEY